MSISRKRAGRKSWNTRLRNANAFASAFAAAAQYAPGYNTDEIHVIRTAKETGEQSVLNFSDFYVEINAWYDRAYCNSSDFGLTDMLCETLLQNAAIHTPKAEYKIAGN